VTIDGVWTGNWIYCPLIHLVTTLQITITHRPMFSVTLLGTGFQCHRFLSFRVRWLQSSLGGTYLTTKFGLFLALKAHGLYCSAHGFLARAQDLLPADPLPPNSKTVPLDRLTTQHNTPSTYYCWSLGWCDLPAS
jgi:hypothetical protein